MFQAYSAAVALAISAMRASTALRRSLAVLARASR